jgi:hypothetical protein
MALGQICAAVRKEFEQSSYSTEALHFIMAHSSFRERNNAFPMTFVTLVNFRSTADE